MSHLILQNHTRYHTHVGTLNTREETCLKARLKSTGPTPLAAIALYIMRAFSAYSQCISTDYQKECIASRELNRKVFRACLVCVVHFCIDHFSSEWMKKKGFNV